jgi:hypothetical protein
MVRTPERGAASCRDLGLNPATEPRSPSSNGLATRSYSSVIEPESLLIQRTASTLVFVAARFLRSCTNIRSCRVLACAGSGAKMVPMGYKFRAPGMANLREWSRIETALQGGDYCVRSVRKQKQKPKLSPQLRVALGVYGKRIPKKKPTL